MFKNLTLGLGALAVVTGVATSVLAAGVTNGSFESQAVIGAFTTEGVGSTDIADWTVVSGTVDHIGTHWDAQDGTQSIDMSGYEAGAISTQVPTTAGVKYKVTFYMAGNPDGGPVVKNLDVSAAGDTASYTFDTTGATHGDMKWVMKTFVFTATGTTATLSFTSTDNTAFGPALDAVSVSEYVPLSKEECKKDGWMDFGMFKNQGDCVSYLQSNEHAVGNKTK